MTAGGSTTGGSDRAGGGAVAGLGASTLRAVMVSFRDLLAEHAERLNRLNVFPVPDGDTGTNMARTVEAVVEALDGAADDAEATFRAISQGSLLGARGNSGLILSQLLRGLVDGLRPHADGSPAAVAAAMTAAAQSAYAAVSRPVEGTILTVAREAAAAADRAAARGASLVELFDAAHEAGADALARTPDLLPALREAGVVDAGGAGFLLLVDAMLAVVDGRSVPHPDASAAPRPAPTTRAHAAGPRHEVMFLYETSDPTAVSRLRAAWDQLGDSIAIVGDGELHTCHVHTDQPAAAIEVALDAGGRPRRITIADLWDEADAVHRAREVASLGQATADTDAIGAVAVAVGPGVCELLADLGAVVVAGGQTMNPSVAELLRAVESIAASHVVVLPGNANVVPVAERIDALTAKRVTVVPTRSVVATLAALVAFDPNGEPHAVASAMADAAAAVQFGEVTRAVRDATGPHGTITTGDLIGLVDGIGIVAAGTDLASTLVGVLERLVGPQAAVVTILAGEGATAGATAAARQWLADRLDDAEVQVHDGGQPLYPYVVGVE